MNRVRTAETYTNLVRTNEAIINNLVNIPLGERNSLEGFARFQLAASISDMLKPYTTLLTVIGAPVQGIRTGIELRLEAIEITRAIPIGIRVQNDRAGRIQGAFARALTDLGFQSGAVNSRYVLDVNIVTTPVDILNNPNRWTRIEVAANLRDNRLGTVLLPYNFNYREGHTTQAEADNRAYLVAERRVNEEYTDYLSDYLSRLLPVR